MIHETLNLKEMKILLVDDTSSNIDVLMKTLEPEGYSLAVASSGKKALEIAQRFLPDLILLDIVMPRFDGFETCRQLKKKEATQDIPVIFITARNDPDDIIKGFDAGGVDYISKPFRQEEVCVRVRTHLKLRNLMKRLEYLARTDQLTGLSNRRDILTKIEQEIFRYQRNKRTFILIMCDIDHFKTINDTYGHDAGDCILINVAQALKEAVRNYDTVGRWGGEEFLIVLPETELADGIQVAEKLRLNVESKEFYYNEKKLKITISFGVSIYEDGMTIDTCIKRADERLYIAKETGRNKIIPATNISVRPL